MQENIKNNQELIQFLTNSKFSSEDKKIISKFHFSKNKLMFQIFNYLIHETKHNWSKCLKKFKSTYKKYLKYLFVVGEKQPSISINEFLNIVNEINGLVQQYKQSLDETIYSKLTNKINELKQKINLNISEIANQYIQSIIEIKKANLN